MRDKLTMREFGHWGRAGNQLFQYSFLTGYAAQYGLQLQLPPWVGNRLFGTTDLPITAKGLPRYTEKGGGINEHVQPIGDVLVNHDFRGYAQYHTSYYIEDKQRIQHLFRPTDKIYKQVAPLRDKLRNMSHTIVSIHLRRGDYGRGIFPIIPTSWYLTWLKENWHRFDSPVLFIATEDTALVKEFAEYDPQIMETLGYQPQKHLHPGDLQHDLDINNLRALDWYPDFYLLSQSDVILGPSSTFSFFAAMLAPQLREYWRGELAPAKFVRLDPWDSWPLLREHVKDFPHLEGIVPESNEYW